MKEQRTINPACEQADADGVLTPEEQQMVHAYLQGHDLPAGDSEEDSSSVKLGVKTEPHLFPSGKPGQTTKSRRYLPKEKRSDAGKSFGKKGKSYKELKSEQGKPSHKLDALQVESEA